MKEAHEHDPPVSATPSEVEQQLEANLGDEMQHLIEVVRFGHEAELFVAKNPIGKYLVAKAEDQLNEATRLLLDMDSLRGKKARETHFRAKVAIGMLRLINEAVEAGHDAEKQIQAQDET